LVSGACLNQTIIINNLHLKNQHPKPSIFRIHTPSVKNLQKRRWVILVAPTKNTIHTPESPTPDLIHKKINNFLSKFILISNNISTIVSSNRD